METGFSKFFRSLRDAEIILRAGQRIISEINILVENSQGSSQIPKSNPQLLNAEIKKKIARHENIKTRFLKWGNRVTPHCGKKKLLVLNPQSVKYALLVKATHPITWTGDNYGKTLAICQALDDLVESNVNLLVLSDSLSVLSALQNFSIKSNKLVDLRRWAESNGGLLVTPAMVVQSPSEERGDSGDIATTSLVSLSAKEKKNNVSSSVLLQIF
ncbi:hypothetical protein TNCV_4338031 [Trichonephila clavipes]|uniref:RNase H type-1 domain-containing protein n=1 Tax=Trichonephila clavipes TaxID=2585209 RepID=A0A8X6SN40_TRICX|nr:hypothetical protein TNCV_4338031 [Trichonephila clavipes]